MNTNIILLISVVYSTLGEVPPPPLMDINYLSEITNIGDCQACRIVIESVMNGLKTTAKGTYEGGDSVWQEEKFKRLSKRNEIPYETVVSHVCDSEPIYVAKCRQMYNKAGHFIKQWWERKPELSDDLFAEVCIDILQVCCPKEHYGRDCTACPRAHNNLCSGNGKCRGDSTRKGNGTCACNTGFSGELCDQCASEYYEAFNTDSKMSCLPCHRSCSGGCHEASQKDCVACKPGYVFDSDEGCLDINECDEAGICTKNQFCLNSIGSYMCALCDKSCNGCYGDGPDMCLKCAKAYSKKGELCIADREDEDPSDKLTATRYMTYFGLLIATVILLPKSTTLGSVVGAVVFSYILGAEYYCMINGHTGLVDLKDFDLSQVFRT